MSASQTDPAPPGNPTTPETAHFARSYDSQSEIIVILLPNPGKIGFRFFPTVTEDVSRSPSITDTFFPPSALDCPMIWVKICGIRDEITARQAVEAGVDAIGLNFHAPSPRAVSVDGARQICSLLPASVTPVGLFVNHSTDDIVAVAAACGLRTLQLHGDEPPAQLAELAGFQLIRAIRPETGGLAEVGRSLDELDRVGVHPWAVLLDAAVPGSYGGTGQTLPWHELNLQWSADWPRLILAGGLTPKNVATAIQTVRPWGVDVASGVESTRAIKDPALMQQFVQQARRKIT